jgi:dTDP-glucose 4,6-dehydratase
MSNNLLKKRFDSDTVCLVTGGLGFIGSHFIHKVLGRGWKVINIDKVNYASLDIGINDNENYTFIKEDISELKNIPFCDLIVNFAAESHVDNSILASDPFMKSNINGVHNILEILRKSMNSDISHAYPRKSPLFLQISTDEVYGDIDDGFFKEDERFMPSNPYSASKAAAEMLVRAWGRTYGLPYIITRTTNNYGCGQHPEKLIPMAITRCIQEKPILVFGSGKYVRNWIHVEDNVDAIMHAIDYGEIGNSYNIASPEEYSVMEIVEMVMDRFKIKPNAKNIDNSLSRSGCDVRYALNCDKIKSLGWNCSKNLKDSIDSMIDYYKHGRRSAFT